MEIIFKAIHGNIMLDSPRDDFSLDYSINSFKSFVSRVATHIRGYASACSSCLKITRDEAEVRKSWRGKGRATNIEAKIEK